MGGDDKSLKLLAGKAMIARVIERLRPQVDALVINANGDPVRFSSFSLPVAPDLDTGFAGPLAGVLAGMQWARANMPQAGWIATAACDTPFFPENFVTELRSAAEAGHARIALAASGGRSHYVFALWPVDLAGDLASTLAQGQRKVQDWIERHAHVAVDFAPVTIGGAEVDPFFNANTLEDFAAAEALLQKERS